MSEKKKSNKKSASKSTAAASGSPMDVNLLSQIVELMTENDVNTVDVRDGQRRVVIKRGAAAFAMPAVPQMFAAPVASQAALQLPASAPAAKPANEGEDESKLLPIKSPMVGTFYASPAKGAKPFVTVGSRVDEESDVCIVEAMKVFNNIKAECRGTIARILIQDSQPVEFGQALFLVKPD